MNIHEHQAKELLGSHGVPVQSGRVAFTPEQAVEAAHFLIEQGAGLLIVKSQIHAGGRGKGVVHDAISGAVVECDGKPLRGVKVVPIDGENVLHDVYEIACRMLGNKLITIQTGAEGKVVNRLLIADGVDIEKEFYCSILLDRTSGRNIIMVSTEGGVEIEKVAEEMPEKIVREYMEPGLGLQPFQARRLAFGLGLTGNPHKSFLRFITALYNAYLALDTSMLEVNPMVLTTDGEILAVDAKVAFDDNALYRHTDIAAMRDESEEDPLEVEAGKHNLNYIKLDGNVGCMVNGAGLAMATMDIIKLAGGQPANFLDVGGGASVERVAAAFGVMMSDTNVKAVLINIFGGIVRCDRVANGIIQAMQTVEVTVPVIVRLDGTNAEEARQILLSSPLNFSVAATLKDAADKVTEAISGLAETETVASVMNMSMSFASMSMGIPPGSKAEDDDDFVDDEDDDEEKDGEGAAEGEEEKEEDEFNFDEVVDPDALDLDAFDEEDLDDDLEDVLNDDDDDF